MQGESRQYLKTEAGRSLRWLYCLTLVAAIFPVGLFGAAGWVGLATGGGLFSMGRVAVVIFLAMVIYRIVLVARNPQTLSAYIASRKINFLRYLGIFLMAIGLIGSITIFFIRPLTLGLFKNPGDSGVAFFVVGMYLYFVSSFGLVGLLLFEASRLFGFEAFTIDEHLIQEQPSQTASNINIKQPESSA